MFPSGHALVVMLCGKLPGQKVLNLIIFSCKIYGTPWQLKKVGPQPNWSYTGSSVGHPPFSQNLQDRLCLAPAVFGLSLSLFICFDHHHHQFPLYYALHVTACPAAGSASFHAVDLWHTLIWHGAQ
jgi:hypothetical protein